ncbi:hypothetical protein [Saccharothrix xinjiangensis]|uniref:Uncharacterized protein n=1 Tax=Saccharothrix xinjiangensis TaxID=204798 RepID=A0ABV9YBF4_9PSEU
MKRIVFSVRFVQPVHPGLYYRDERAERRIDTTRDFSSRFFTDLLTCCFVVNGQTMGFPPVTPTTSPVM